MFCKPVQQNMVLMLSKLDLHTLHALPPHKGKATSTPCPVPALSVIKNWVCTCPMPPMSLRLGKHNLSVACPKRKKHKQPKNRSKNHQQRSPKLWVSWYLYYFFANALHGRKFNDTEMAQDKPIWPNKGQHKPQNTPTWLNMSPIWCRHSPQWPNISPRSGKHSLSAACHRRKKQKQPKT